MEVSKRGERVAGSIRDAVAGAIRAMEDPRLGLVSVTRCELSPDLGHARLFVSVYGDEQVVASSLKALRGATGYVRSAVGQRVRLRYTPEIEWAFDDTMAKSERLERLFRSVSEGEDSD